MIAPAAKWGDSPRMKWVLADGDPVSLGSFAAWWMIPHKLCAWWTDRYEPIGDEL